MDDGAAESADEADGESDGESGDENGVESGDENGVESDDETVRVWLVDRQSYDENLITLVYATTDGERHLTKQRSWELLRRKPVTAAIDVAADRLEETPSETDRGRYATQASRMAEDHDPDDTV